MFKLKKYLVPYLGWLAVLIVLVIGQSLLDLWIPDLMQKVTEQLNPGGTVQNMLIFGGQALAVAAGAVVIGVTVALFSSRISNGAAKDLRKAVFEKVESFSLQEIDGFKTSSLITRTTNDITQITMALNMMFRMFFAAPVMLVGGIIMALQKAASLTLVIAITAPILLILVVIIGLKAIPLFRKVQDKIDALTVVGREGLTGVRVIRAFGNDDVQKEKFEHANADMAKLQTKVNRIMSFMMPVVTLLFTATTITIWLVATKTLSGTKYAGVLNAERAVEYLASAQAVMQYGMRIMMAFMMFAMMFVVLPRAQACAKRVYEVLSTPLSIDENEDGSLPDTLDKNSESYDKGTVLKFDHVNFAFPGADEAALEGITFEARRGATTAIIGGTGSGKSTILNLVMRFYDVTDGAITLGGEDIRKLPAKKLRDKIGYVPQKPVLFEGTVAANLAVGKLDATEDEMREACRIAHADEFIAAMPNGYQSSVSQGGTNFSGGQKQRLGIARAIVRKPEIYMFDDSFSALDYKTDAELRKKLTDITKDSITVIVAQRISTIMYADNIIVLKDGKIEGQGTHKQLLESCPEYAQIARSQLKEEELTK